MNLYDIYGNLIDFGGSEFTVKRNSDELVAEFIGVGETFVGQTDITYKDGDTIFYKSTATNGIDCSTFVGLCLMGLEYQMTPYYTHQYTNPNNLVINPNYNWAIRPMSYQISRYIDGSNPTEQVKLACQLGRWMESRGQKVPLTNGFADVRPGDIVFYARKVQETGEWSNPTWYDHINHVGIIYSKEDAPNTYIDGDGNTQTWDKTKYPYKHVIMDSGNTTPTCRLIHWLEEGQEDPTNVYKNNVNTVVMICRPDLGALQASE